MRITLLFLFVIALWPYPGPGPGLSEGEVMKQVEENLKSQWKSFEFDLQVLGKSKVLSKNLKATAIFFNKLDLVPEDETRTGRREAARREIRRR